MTSIALLRKHRWPPRQCPASSAVISLRIRSTWSAGGLGEALQEIRACTLYRELGYASFEAYWEGRWRQHRSRAYRRSTRRAARTPVP
jgi:hypothetical protein